MRRIFAQVILVLLLSGVLDAASEPRYFFYKATKNDATFYILGSMHMGRPQDADYPAKIYQALDASRMLILEGEVRKEKIQAFNPNYMYLGDKQTIAQLLTAEESARLEKVAKLVGLQMKTFERMQPWLIEFMFGYRMAFNDGFVLEYGTEHRLIRYLTQHAKKDRAKKIFALESSDEVVRNMSRIPVRDQLRRFRAFLSYSDEKLTGNAVEMFDYWRAGDEQKVLQIFRYYEPDSNNETDKYLNTLLYDRNRRLAARLDLVSRYPGKYFVVTGALHLIGKKNILEQLTAAGYTVERL